MFGMPVSQCMTHRAWYQFSLCKTAWLRALVRVREAKVRYDFLLFLNLDFPVWWFDVFYSSLPPETTHSHAYTLMCICTYSSC